MFFVQLIADDPRFGLRAGDILEVEPYWLDPSDKFTVIRRVGDDFDPSCNVYRSQVSKVVAGIGPREMILADIVQYYLPNCEWCLPTFDGEVKP